MTVLVPSPYHSRTRNSYLASHCIPIRVSLLVTVYIIDFYKYIYDYICCANCDELLVSAAVCQYSRQLGPRLRILKGGRLHTFRFVISTVDV